ncbi:heme ABC transporter ATP-binding protein [Salinarchaeum sp. IM2453]|uniref:heme ABC transporter ATP-binding protein n=1 Tax=Salinarchaeum sp. IM2453 TaxID=2862870 RepID=UPI001C83C415|nr:heme ABC transporter ATP-binding protein [Salinarchaeum sp. IM2453]QZA87944.1 heme ABC transporter ATP-binding protein [Salinarchaeum sp. IM2453]
MINIKNINITLGSTEILSDVSLTVEAGSFVGLIGPNGAGKTTLLRTLNGYLEPDGGRIRVDDADVSTLSSEEIGRRVATVPQKTTFAFDFSVEEIVAMGRMPHQNRLSPTTKEDKMAVQRALDKTRTAQFAERNVRELSGGERQRVLLAQALAQSTPVLLLDEPTANLDVNHQVQTLSLVRELADSGKTVIAAIHDLELAARFCDDIALLADGTIAAHGSPKEVYTTKQLEETFGVQTAIGTNPETGTPTVTALAE